MSPTFIEILKKIVTVPLDLGSLMRRFVAFPEFRRSSQVTDGRQPAMIALNLRCRVNEQEPNYDRARPSQRHLQHSPHGCTATATIMGGFIGSVLVAGGLFLYATIRFFQENWGGR
jgi:hypothetical protein